MLIFTSVISIFIYFKPQVNIPLTQPSHTSIHRLYPELKIPTGHKYILG